MVRNEMAIIVAASVLLLSLLISWAMLKQVIAVCYHHGIFDSHDERKIHTGNIPRMGGIVFFPAVAITLLLVTLFSSLFGYRDVGELMILKGAKLIAILCALFIMFVFGLADDFKGVRFRTKFISQIIAALILCLAGLWLKDLHGIFGLHQISPWLGWPITVFAVMFVINALNFIDGIDGQAASLSILALTYYTVIFIVIRHFDFGILSLSFIGTIVPFLLYNLTGSVNRKSKIFMGDTGSTMLGTILLVLGVELNDALATVNQPFNPMVIAFSPLILPCYDVMRIVIERIRNGKSPFKPDNNHIHHKLLYLLHKQHYVLPVVLCMSITITTITILLSMIMNVNLALLCSLVIWFATDYMINKSRNNKR